MKKRVLHIPVDGPTQVVDVNATGNELAALQQLVGGYIEEVVVDAKNRLAFYINEEGKIGRLLPINLRATAMSGVLAHGDVIVGPAVLFRYEDADLVDEPAIATIGQTILVDSLATETKP